MHKLLLVEDEEEVRESVLQEIDWNRYGYEVIDKAENGKDAIECIERNVPDVVVTDIRMPFMDGMQLSEWIRAHYPTTKIIILTGHDEFEYAQKAVKLQIDEYVLKPFSSQELIIVLKRLKDQLVSEMEQKENIHLLEEHYRKSLPVLREVFLSSLVSTTMRRNEIEEKAYTYNLDLSGSGYVVSVLSIDDPGTKLAGNSPVVISPSLKDSKDRQLQLFAVLNIAQEISIAHSIGHVFIHHDHIIMLSVSGEEDPERIMERLLTVLEEIRQSTEKYLKITLTIGVGTVVSEISQINYSYKDANQALDYRMILGTNRVICINDVETRFAEKLRFDELKEHALLRGIKVGTPQEMKSVVDELFAGVTDTNISVKDYQIFLVEIVTSILTAAKDLGTGMDEIFGADFDPFAEIRGFTHVDQAMEWILHLCLNIMGHISNQRQYAYKSLVDQAKDYAKAHYHETDVSINKVCGHLHISAGYFSSIFKKECKTTFVAYLQQIRMEAAQEMLRTTDLKLFEIAEKVGFAEPNYFSFSFRKLYGISPKEYRNSMKEG
ncbi:transcriptional regulator [Paenibacillus swuensis]|uniref:Transcriptional regulator n=1 Tax=Paenibacillus swuensis TaxID=1178515 RepID=A0A172TED6_9BACL|nr:response regulator [Paenibacillus swuensis]ANE45153.1 transcriptional regulator [Paenibacillus swuensis]